jgi:hypothetical protein
MDEVALRSSPIGPRRESRFHNLVASLRSDVRVVVEDHTGQWIKVRVISGSAFAAKDHRPADAAGLVGYVSAELLVRQDAVVPSAEPTPTADPAAYRSLEDFSAAWPDRVTSSEVVERVWLSQPREVWKKKALAAAGIDPSQWQPAKGFRRSKEIFQKVYSYYASLYLADNRLKWAAMAKLAGGEVFRGYRDELVPSEQMGEGLSGLNETDSLALSDLLGGAVQMYSKSLDILLLEMQKAIFVDLAWQHEAYREGGIKALAAATARGELSEAQLKAWQDIDSGQLSRVNAGNLELLRREQLTVLQGQGFYGRIQAIPDDDVIPETMSAEARSPIPGGKPFASVVPGGDITKFDDRWKWLADDMIPAFQGLSATQLDGLVRKSLDELADRKFGVVSP